MQRVEDFLARVGDGLLTLSCRESNIAPDSLLAIDRRRAEELKAGDALWITQFERGVSQALIKQYTNLSLIHI